MTEMAHGGNADQDPRSFLDRVDEIYAIAFAGIPHVAVRVCHDRPGQTGYTFTLETETWGPSLNRSVQTSWISAGDEAVHLAMQGDTRFGDDAIIAAQDTDDVETLLLFLRHLAGVRAQTQRERVARASALGMRHPGPRLDLMTVTETLRIDHLSIDVDLATILQRQGVDIADHVRRTMPRMHDPIGAVSDPWMGDEDLVMPTTLSDESGAMVLTIETSIVDGATYDGVSLRIKSELCGQIPDSVAIVAAGRSLGGLIETGTALDQRVIEGVDIGDGWMTIRLILRQATLGALGIT